MKLDDIIRWADVPDGAMVRSDPDTGIAWHYVKVHGGGFCVGCGPADGSAQGDWGSALGSPRRVWGGWNAPDHPVTLVARGLTGHEDASALRTLADAARQRRRA